MRATRLLEVFRRSSSPAARNAVEVCLAIKPDEKRRADRRRGQRAKSRPASRPRSTASARRPTSVLIERVATRPMTAAPRRGAGRTRALRRRDPVRAAAAGGTRRPHGDRRRRRAPADPLRPHGRRHAGDHDAGNAGRLPAGRSPEHEAVRADADAPSRCASRRRSARRCTATFDPVAALGQDQRPDQHALLVEPAGRRGLHDAGVGRRRLRLQRARRATTSVRSTATCRRRR